MNRVGVNACPLVSSIAQLREKPNYYTQKQQLPTLKKDLVKVFHSGELLDLKRVDSTVLQDVSKRVDQAFERFIVGDSQGGKSGKPRFKSESSFKTMTFANAKESWIKLIRKNWLYLRLPKLGIIKVRMHRPIPNGFVIKQISVTKKAVLPHMLCLCITEYKIGKRELQLTELLNLTDVEVEYYQNLGQELILYVELKGNYATCPRCGQVSHHLPLNHIKSA